MRLWSSNWPGVLHSQWSVVQTRVCGNVEERIMNMIWDLFWMKKEVVEGVRLNLGSRKARVWVSDIKMLEIFLHHAINTSRTIATWTSYHTHQCMNITLEILEHYTVYMYTQSIHDFLEILSNALLWVCNHYNDNINKQQCNVLGILVLLDHAHM